MVHIINVVFIFPSSAVPDMPTGPIKFRDITPSSRTMDWLAPKSDGGSKLSGYKIQVTTDQKISTEVTITNKTSHTFQDLKPNQSYYFSVIAFNDVGDSKPLVSDCINCQAPTGMSTAMGPYSTIKLNTILVLNLN